MKKINYNTSRKLKQKIIVSNKSKKARTVNFCFYMPTVASTRINKSYKPYLDEKFKT